MRRITWSLLLACLVLTVSSQTFTNMTSLLNTTGSVGCVLDMDGDGLDDVVTILNSSGGYDLYIDYQQPDGTFILESFDTNFQNYPSWSIAAGDLDENGYADLIIGGGSRVSFIYANDDGTDYSEVFIDEYIFSQRTNMVDIDNDGDLDAFACHDVDESHPYRNDGFGNMTEDQTLIQTVPIGGNYASIWTDFDNDGDVDMYMSKCRGGAPSGDPQRDNALYVNDGSGNFTEEAAIHGLFDNEQSWVTVFEDFDNDGDMDAYTVNHTGTNKLYENDGSANYSDVTSGSGIDANDLDSWSCIGADFDNDGFVDILSESQVNKQFYHNDGGLNFTASSLPFDDGALCDLNNDGFIDVYNGVRLWMNDGNSNHWSKIHLTGTDSNLDGVGARLEIYGAWGKQIRECRAGENFRPMSSMDVFFGLGAATAIDSLIVRWPSGQVDRLVSPPIDTRLEITETPLPAPTPCEAGFADIYPCSGYDLVAQVPVTAMGGSAFDEALDLWGWEDRDNGKEYAIVGLSSGTAFIDITDGLSPRYIGFLPTHTTSSAWRDVKVYQDHAFIVSEAPGHGMQVFDLSRLQSAGPIPVTFTADAHYSGFGNAHNIVIDEDSGFAYAVGSDTYSGGLHIINIQNPTSPVLAGSFSEDGYTHDAQTVVYNGPDADYQGRQMCFASNEDTFTIVDVEDKTDPVMVSRTGYTGSAYTHQGWLTEDQRYFLMNDELDELSNGHNTRTYIWDVLDLDAPVALGVYESGNSAIDHNLYTHEGRVYQANYRSGMRVLDLGDIANANLSELGFFDVYPANDAAAFNGAWSVYPYLPSDNIIISSIEGGLFIVRESEPLPCPSPIALAVTNVNETSAELNWSELGAATSWTIEYGPEGFTLGTGIQENAGNTQYVLDGLTSGTRYDVYVRSDCGFPLSNSPWFGPVLFTTVSDYCSGDQFLDSGGADSNYGDDEDEVYVMCPDDPGNGGVTLTFTSVDIEVHTSGNGVQDGCWDFLTIYNGPDVNAPVLAATLCGELDGSGQVPSVPSSLLQAGDEFVSTDASGCLTVRFRSDGLVNEPGWTATVSCPEPVCAVPSELDVIEIGFGGAAPRVNGTWTNPNNTTDCEVRGGRISAGTAGTANPEFANINNTQVISQTDGSTLLFNIVLYNNPNVPFVTGQTYGYEVRCLCEDGLAYSEWSGITPESTFIVPVQGAVGDEVKSMTSLENRTLMVRPNPNDGQQMDILIPEFGAESGLLQIRDMTGRIVWQSTGQSGLASGWLNIEPEAELVPGLYLIELVNREEVISTRFVVD